MRAQATDSRPETGRAALRSAFSLLDHWRIGAEQARILLGVPQSTYFRWRKRPDEARLSLDTLERISYLLGIFKALRTIYGEQAVGDGWLRRINDNPEFGGAAPLSRLLGGRVSDLYETRRHLDARAQMT